LPRVISSPDSASPATGTLSWPQLYTGLGFTTLATLMLELSLTRLFSVVFYYHFAFLAISVALFGLGAGGVFSYVVAGWRGNLFAKLGTLAAADGVCVLASLWFILSRSNHLGNVTLAAVYVASALPFFFAGAVVSLAVSEAIERVDRAYFFDLAGAASGCLLLIPFLNIFGGPNTVIAAGVFYTVAASIWFNMAGSARRRAATVLGALVLVTLIVLNFKSHILDVRYAKGQRIPQERFVAWNSFSRVGVHFDGIWSIAIDADAATGIAAFDWDHREPDQMYRLTHSGPGSPYLVRPGAKTLIIGAGGGYDVARALASGSRDITAVEINPIIANTIMRDKFAAESRGIYFRPEVRVFVEDGRSFVRRSDEKYQVLQATLVDTWASTAAGAFALSENNLYTSDAFYDYLTHLTDDGILAFTRWGFDPPRESLRLLSLGIDALNRLGESHPSRHFMVVREDAAKLGGWGAQDTVLLSRKPFSADDIARLQTELTAAHLQSVYKPGDPPVNPFGELLASAHHPSDFYSTYKFDVSPVPDDRPFLLYNQQPRDLMNFIAHANESSADYKINRAVPLLFGLMGVSIVATLLILLLPRVLLRHRLPGQKGVLPFLGFFLCLGAGYILIQVALIQKFVLLLGHPTYALTVIVFSMLVASGAGSYFSRRVAANDSRLMGVLAAIAALVACLALGASPLTSAAASWPLLAKMAVTTAAIAPAAFLMGMPFPSGLRRLEQWHPPSIRWAWSLNAAASVLGSAGAIVLAIYFGLRATLLIGGALYLCALFVIFATRFSVAKGRE
jgi:hypothetical protein